MTIETARTTCPYCGVGCGVIASQTPAGEIRIEGDQDHPANFGKLCSKGASLGETLSLDSRLLHPRIQGRQTDWDEALDHVASTFKTTIERHGPESVALYVSGQLLTEDYYVANKLMKGFIGTANIDTNSRLCMASSVAGHRRAFGTDTVPGSYDDLDEAGLVVIVGSNFAWCHPVLYQRILRSRQTRNTKIIVIDPRVTATAEHADLHLAIAPDADLPVFLGLLKFLQEGGYRDCDYVDRFVGDPQPALEVAATHTIPVVAQLSGLAACDIEEFYQHYARTKKVVTIYSQGINQSVSGADKVNAIINCHLLTGRIGKPGMGPFSITGQPNAMGGREVGGLANMLAAHMDIENPQHRDIVQRFWNSPSIASKPGLKAVDMFDAVGDGRIKAIWIMATNPVVSIPDSNRVVAALQACPFVVVSDVVDNTDTVKFADVLLPAAAWAEKDGTVTNSERRISRQRSFLPLPGQARPDWWQLAQVAKRMGFSGFDYASAAEIFAEHAALSGFENNGQRDFNISAYAEISEADFSGLPPFQWPQKAGEARRDSRFFADGLFYTPDRRARMIATPPRISEKQLSAEYPFWLNTGRIRDQWHTMTRTSKAHRLFGQYGEPFCEIHPDDAKQVGILPADILRLKTQQGEGLFRALITSRQRRGSLFVPMHWTSIFASQALANATTSPANDPVSGQPGLKACAASVSILNAKWFGFAVCVKPPASIDASYWALARAKKGFRIEMAGDQPVVDWKTRARDLFGVPADAQWTIYEDSRSGSVRLAAFVNDKMVSALFVSAKPVTVARNYAASLLDKEMDQGERMKTLAGCAGAGQVDNGDILCSCFEIGSTQIVRTIQSGQATNVEMVGELLKAGTNCGSCRSEIRRLIEAHKLVHAA